ncbi:hypothetical protein DINM_004013 [Dirofilaria immitis]|nr:hypothetical protein [Dirofilaria immitis]
MIEIFSRYGIVFIVTISVTVSTDTAEPSSCSCPPCQTSEFSCPKSIICPKPNICPEKSCPIPPPCPQPPPCPPCLNPVIQQPVLVPQEVTVPVIRKIPVVENTCCTTCTTPCITRKKRELSIETNEGEIINNTVQLSMNSICNSKSLQKIMNENITPSVIESQRLIQNASETHLGGYFNVLCSNNDLSYSAFTTSTFCQHQKDNVICYAFKAIEFQ